VYPKITKTDADEPSSNDWQSGQAGAGQAGHGGSTHILAAGFPPQAGRGGLRIATARRAGMVAALGGSWQIFESLTHEGYSDCSRSSGLAANARTAAGRRPDPPPVALEPASKSGVIGFSQP